MLDATKKKRKRNMDHENQICLVPKIFNLPCHRI
jgi:hypothetical protein